MPPEKIKKTSTIRDLIHPNLILIQSTISLMLGISLTLYHTDITLLGATFAFGIFATTALLFRDKKRGQVCILLFVFCLGSILTLHKTKKPQTPHIAGFITTTQQVTCSGIIYKAIENNAERVKILLDLKTVYSSQPLSDQSQPLKPHLFSTQVQGLVRLSMPSFFHETLKPGDLITLQTTLSPPRGFINPGGFNLPHFLQSRNIFITGWAPRPDNMIIQPTTPPLHRLDLHGERIRATLIAFYKKNLSPTNSALFSALITGDRSNLSPYIQEMFKNLGIFHLLAISGIHMGILAGFIMWITLKIIHLFPRLMLHIPAKQMAATIAILPIILYCCISGLQPPAIRACLMTILLFSAFIFRSQWHGPTAIAIAALVLLSNNPLLLGTVSFQLSFTAVSAIVLSLPLVKNRIFKADPSLPRKLTQTLLAGLSISVIASLATLPLLLFHFNRISLISPIATLFMEPLLCLWALGFGLIGSLLSFWSPELGVHLLQIGSIGFDWCLKIGSIMQQIPHINLWLSAPALWKIWLYYPSLFLLFRIQKPKQVTLYLCSLALLLIPAPMDTTASRITMLDVGKGNSTVIQCQTGETIMIDCGGPTGLSFDIGRQVIGPFLRYQHISKLDLLILSHADLDHYSGAAFIIEQFRPKELWLPYLKSDNRQWDLMVQQAKIQGVIIRIPNKGQTLALSEKTRLTSIATSHLLKKNWSENNQSLVISYSNGPISFLFPGDIEQKAEHYLISENNIHHSTILVAPHHGSRSSSSIDFVQKVRPHYVVFSASPFGKSIFPAEKIVQRYKNSGSTILKTATRGAVVFEIRKSGLFVNQTANTKNINAGCTQCLFHPEGTKSTR